MKTLILLVICCCTSFISIAQKDSLKFDENNRYVYYQVVEKPDIGVDTLYSRAKSFAQKLDKAKLTEDRSVSNIAVASRFLVYMQSLASKKDAGEVKFLLTIDAKPGKYRYKFTDFVFTPYKIDRYGNMVPVPGMNMPIERLSGQYSRKDIDSFLNQIGQYCKATGDRLQLTMEKKQPSTKDVPTKKVDTSKW